MDKLIKDNHAGVDQLLDIRDGLASVVSEHVASCPDCQQTLTALSEIGQTVGRTLFDDVPEAQAEVFERVWLRVEKSLETETKPSSILISADVVADVSAKKFQWNSLSAAVYTLAVSVLLTGLISLYNNQQQGAMGQQTELLQASIDELMLNSRGLESVLQQVAAQSSDLSTAERRVTERLYWRLSYLDQMISENKGRDRPDSERVKALWGSRINALTELNYIYSNDQQVAFGAPEI